MLIIMAPSDQRNADSEILIWPVLLWAEGNDPFRLEETGLKVVVLEAVRKDDGRGL
jgi:hypothetical protein